MTYLLHADPVQRVLVRLGGNITAKVDALEQVLHHRPHLTKLTAQPLWKGVPGSGIRFVDDDLVDSCWVAGLCRLLNR